MLINTISRTEAIRLVNTTGNEVLRFPEGKTGDAANVEQLRISAGLTKLGLSGKIGSKVVLIVRENEVAVKGVVIFKK